MAHPHNVLDSPQLHQLVLADHSATIGCRTNVGIEAKQLLCRLKPIEKVVDARSRSDGLELRRRAPEALQEEFFSGLDVCAILEPEISRNDPTNTIRVY